MQIKMNFKTTTTIITTTKRAAAATNFYSAHSQVQSKMTQDSVPEAISYATLSSLCVEITSQEQVSARQAHPLHHLRPSQLQSLGLSVWSEGSKQEA